MPRPSEATVVHTRILRCALAVDSSHAYWRNAAPEHVPAAQRTLEAFEERWFGEKSERRVHSIITEMIERFDLYPEAFAFLHQMHDGREVPARLRAFACHIHTQLADPIYRRFTGDLLPQRRELGQKTIDRETTARWVDGIEPGRWAKVTCLKLAASLLSAAADAGLIDARRDPCTIKTPVVPHSTVGYVLYLLRGVSIEGSILDNPYLRSLGITPATFGAIAPRVPGIHYTEDGAIIFLEPSLDAWAKRTCLIAS